MPRDEVHSVAVLGLGTMGHGIAQTFAAAGYAVRCYDEQPAARASLHERVRVNLLAFVEAGLVPRERIEPTLSRLAICGSEEETLAGVGFVTEVVNEDLVLKQELFARLEALVTADTILASNSSTFPISQSGARMQRPERALVTHWFNPPHLVPLVEVVPGPDTREETTRTTMALMQRIGKQPLRLRKELPGFLVNRIQVAIQREVWDLLEQGVASAEEIDSALRGSVGFRMAAVGPLEVHDFGRPGYPDERFTGTWPLTFAATAEVPALVQKLVEQGCLGAKTGRGFHEYSSEQLVERRRAARRAVPVSGEAALPGVQRRSSMNVDAKVALITGGATGLGRATGLALARLGCSVAVNHIASTRLEARADCCRANRDGCSGSPGRGGRHGQPSLPEDGRGHRAGAWPT